MPNTKSFKPLLFLTVGVLAAPACTLPPPPKGNPGDAGQTFVCADDNVTVDGGALMSNVDGGSNNIDNVVTPIQCTGDNSSAAAALFTYAPGYQTDPAVHQKVTDTLNSMTLWDEAEQMRGTPYGNAYALNTTDVERSDDTRDYSPTIRGFHYRDASRGMNLAEDISGVLPNAGTIDGAQSAIPRSSRSAWPAARPSTSISSTPSARRSATRCRQPRRRCCLPRA